MVEEIFMLVILNFNQGIRKAKKAGNWTNHAKDYSRELTRNVPLRDRPKS